MLVGHCFLDRVDHGSELLESREHICVTLQVKSLLHNLVEHDVERDFHLCFKAAVVTVNVILHFVTKAVQDTTGFPGISDLVQQVFEASYSVKRFANTQACLVGFECSLQLHSTPLDKHHLEHFGLNLCLQEASNSTLNATSLSIPVELCSFFFVDLTMLISLFVLLDNLFNDNDFFRLRSWFSVSIGAQPSVFGGSRVVTTVLNQLFILTLSACEGCG